MPSDIDATIERFRQEMAHVDEAAQVLLKGHLLIEEALTSILERHVFHPEHLADARLSFHQKSQLARSLALRKNKLGEWELMAAINALRNEISHQLNSEDRDKKLARVKELYFREAEESSAIEAVKRESDAVVLFGACAHCAGFLATYSEDAKSVRRMIHAMDRSLNPDLPEFEL